jgi:hypothetical protein
MGGSTRGRKGDVDALAATVLLQHALRMHELPAVDPLAGSGGPSDTTSDTMSDTVPDATTDAPSTDS